MFDTHSATRVKPTIVVVDVEVEDVEVEVVDVEVEVEVDVELLVLEVVEVEVEVVKLNDAVRVPGPIAFALVDWVAPAVITLLETDQPLNVYRLFGGTA